MVGPSEDTLLNKLFTTVTHLINIHHLPCMVVYQKHAQLNVFGSKQLETKMKTAYLEDISWKRAMQSDLEDMVTNINENHVNIADPSRARQEVRAGNPPARLDYPLR